MPNHLHDLAERRFGMLRVARLERKVKAVRRHRREAAAPPPY